jgi:hypothetical protein
MTIIVQTPTSPKLTEKKAKDGRFEILDKGQSRKVAELRALKSKGQRAVDPAALMELMLDGKDVPAPDDVDTKLTAELLKWQTIVDARQPLKQEIDAAYREAATAVLKGIKPEHDAVVQRIVGPLVEVSKAYVEIFDLGRQLKDKDCGWREGVCDLLPALVELFGATNAHSPLATLLQEAVRLGYVKVGQVPKELRA